MTRVKRPGLRCDLCFMRKEICLCEAIASARAELLSFEAPNKLRTRVVVLMHHRERLLTTNTGRLVQQIIPNSDIRIRGLPNETTDTEGLVGEGGHTFLMYPSDTARILDPDWTRSLKGPVTLIVPDGSWRQASKVAKREPSLQSVPHVTLPLGEPSLYQLRHEHKLGGLATLEAVARALGFFESPRVQTLIEEVFNLMVARTLRSRAGTLVP